MSGISTSILNPSELKFLWKRRGNHDYDLKSFISDGRFIHHMVFEDIRNHQNVLGKIVASPREGEAYHWPRLQHENLAPLLDIVSINEMISVYIFPFIGRHLREIIHDTVFISDPDCFKRKKSYAEDILWALDYLHEKSLCLMNLTDAIIRICDLSDKAVIYDFSCLVLVERVTKDKMEIPILYQAPELKTRENFDPIAAAMWSCGVMMLQMFTKHVLPSAFIGDEVNQVLKAVKEINYEMIKETHPGAELNLLVVEDLKQFLNLFLTENPKCRMRAKSLAISPFLRGSKLKCKKRDGYYDQQFLLHNSHFKYPWPSNQNRPRKTWHEKEKCSVAFQDIYLNEVAKCRDKLKKLPCSNKFINLNFIPGGNIPQNSNRKQKTPRNDSEELKSEIECRDALNVSSSNKTPDVSPGKCSLFLEKQSDSLDLNEKLMISGDTGIDNITKDSDDTSSIKNSTCNRTADADAVSLEKCILILEKQSDTLDISEKLEISGDTRIDNILKDFDETSLKDPAYHKITDDRNDNFGKILTFQKDNGSKLNSPSLSRINVSPDSQGSQSSKSNSSEGIDANICNPPCSENKSNGNKLDAKFHTLKDQISEDHITDIRPEPKSSVICSAKSFSSDPCIINSKNSQDSFNFNLLTSKFFSENFDSNNNSRQMTIFDSEHLSDNFDDKFACYSWQSYRFLELQKEGNSVNTAIETELRNWYLKGFESNTGDHLWPRQMDISEEPDMKSISNAERTMKISDDTHLPSGSKDHAENELEINTSENETNLNRKCFRNSSYKQAIHQSPEGIKIPENFNIEEVNNILQPTLKRVSMKTSIRGYPIFNFLRRNQSKINFTGESKKNSLTNNAKRAISFSKHSSSDSLLRNIAGSSTERSIMKKKVRRKWLRFLCPGSKF